MQQTQNGMKIDGKITIEFDPDKVLKRNRMELCYG